MWRLNDECIFAIDHSTCMLQYQLFTIQYKYIHPCFLLISLLQNFRFISFEIILKSQNKGIVA